MRFKKTNTHFIAVSNLISWKVWKQFEQLKIENKFLAHINEDKEIYNKLFQNMRNMWETWALETRQVSEKLVENLSVRSEQLYQIKWEESGKLGTAPFKLYWWGNNKG